MNRTIMGTILVGVVVIAGISVIFLLNLAFPPPPVEEEVPEQYKDWVLKFTSSNGKLQSNVTLTLTEFVELPSVERYYPMWGGELGFENSSFEGVDISYIFPNVIEFATTPLFVRVTSVDDFQMSFTYTDFTSKPTMMIAYKRDGHFMLGEPEGEDGPLRLIVPAAFDNDFNKQYCAKYLTEVEFL